jgi:small subunit ribosomal protein S13
MIRIAGVIMSQHKHIYITLQNIYGIGKNRAIEICNKLNISISSKIEDIDNKTITEIQKLVNTYKIEGELRREVSMNIKRLVDIKSYRGKRHRSGLPCRGQRTKTNAKTRKKNKYNKLIGKKN